jgi:hypothetical protein
MGRCLWIWGGGEGLVCLRRVLGFVPAAGLGFFWFVALCFCGFVC